MERMFVLYNVRKAWLSAIVEKRHHTDHADLTHLRSDLFPLAGPEAVSSSSSANTPYNASSLPFLFLLLRLLYGSLNFRRSARSSGSSSQSGAVASSPCEETPLLSGSSSDMYCFLRRAMLNADAARPLLLDKRKLHCLSESTFGQAGLDDRACTLSLCRTLRYKHERQRGEYSANYNTPSSKADAILFWRLLPLCRDQMGPVAPKSNDYSAPSDASWDRCAKDVAYIDII